MPGLDVQEIAQLFRVLQKASGHTLLRRILDHVGDDAQATELPLPKLKTAEHLMSESGALPPMLVENLLPGASLFLLTGKPKAGKSFLALDIADCVSRGEPVLGALTVNKPGPVIYLAMEDGQVELARRLAQRRFAPGAHTLYFIDEPFSLTDPINYARLREQIKSVAPALLVIDTAAEALDIRDWVNRSEILAKIAPIRRLAREHCTVLLVAHNRKADGDMGDEIAGSNALAGAVDGWISAYRVERRPNGSRRLSLRIEGRGGGGHERIAEMDHQTLRFSLVGPEEAGQEPDRRSLAAARRAERIVLARNTMQRFGGQVTIAELAAAMSVSYGVAWATIRELAASGALEETRPAADGRGRRTPIYRLKTLAG